MIEHIYDERYFSFSEDLKEEINMSLEPLLRLCQRFFNKSLHYNKGFKTFIRQSGYYEKTEPDYYFVIQLDESGLLELIGDYRMEDKTVTNVHLKGTIPYHDTWSAIDSENLYLTRFQQRELLQLQQTFTGKLKPLGIEIDNVNSQKIPSKKRGDFPKAVVEFRRSRSDELQNMHERSFWSFLNTFYNFNYIVSKRFEEK